MPIFFESPSHALKSSAAAIGCIITTLAMTSHAQAATIVEAGAPGTTGDTALYFNATDVSAVPVVSQTPAQISDKITSWIGVPDRGGSTIGGWTFTIALGIYRLFDGPGADFNVYEDHGGGQSAEFHRVDISVSGDGLNFYSINEFFGNAEDLAGDEIHMAANFRRGYQLTSAASALGVSEFSHIRLSNTGSLNSNSFDFDAVGVRNFREATVQSAVPEPASWAMMLCGIGLLGAALRRRRESPFAAARVC